MLIVRFTKCSRFVKSVLFKTYIVCACTILRCENIIVEVVVRFFNNEYDKRIVHRDYNVTDRFKACYHRCNKNFFGYDTMEWTA